MPIPGDANDAAAQEGLHDGVTGLPSTALLHDRLKVAMVRRRRPRSDSLAVMWIAVAGIGDVGHRRGSTAQATALCAVAARLSELVRAADTVARVGDDQFVVLCEELGDESEAVEIAGRVADGFSGGVHIDGEDQAIVASVGVAVVAGGEMDPGVVFAQARDAMRRARAREVDDVD